MLLKQKIFFLVLFISILFQVPTNGYAQYFGRNKVQYEDFNFQVLHTGHFEIYHYIDTEPAITDIGMLSERWYQRYSKMLNHSFSIKNPIIFYANQADFQQTDVVAQVGIGTGGVTEGLGNRVVMPFAETLSSTNHVLGHELVHAFQYDIARSETIGGIGYLSQLPLWFIEGMAEYLSLGPENTQTAMWLRDAVLYDDIPTIEELADPSEYFPYRYGHGAWAFITGTWGDDVVRDLYVSSAVGGLEAGFVDVLGVTVDSVSAMWEQSIRDFYADDLETKTKPEKTGELILGKEKGTGTLNVSPSLSPNGELVAFISEKNIFSLELFLADAETGDIVKKLTTTEANPHFNALQFIESAGSWSPDGEQFAAVGFIKGDNEIILIDIDEGTVTKSIKFRGIGSINHPAWSPDGSKLAFSGSGGGYSDIYVYDLETDSLRNITSDKYSDLHPEWSPDGSNIAFSTDRGPGTDFDELTFGNMKIGIVDVQSEEIELVPAFYDAKHINPQYSPDGQSIYYVSDYQGYSNVYRYDLQNGNRYQITNVATGISGISELSPAITVADSTGELMVTVFQNTNYSVYKIPEEQLTGYQIVNLSRSLYGNRLPSAENRGYTYVADYLQSPEVGLPADTAFALTDYRPGLNLEYVSGGGGVGVATQYGVGAVGGVNLYFTDILREHQVSATLQLQGDFRDLGAQLVYFNTENRFIWGLSMGHFSFLSRSTSAVRDTVQIDEDTAAEVLRVDQLDRRVYLNQFSVIGQYPFSQIHRMEFNLNYQRLSYDFELRQAYLSPDGSFLLDQTTEDILAPSPLDLASGAIAYVEDNSISAYIGPIRGHRLRFEVEATTGSLQFLTALADYRRYFYMRPFTFAVRGLHYGRYLQDSENNRLSPLFLGYENFVRGYNIASFSPQECSDSQGGDCPQFSRLVGSRIAVANVEFRIPVLGVEQLALFRTRVLPTTFSLFFDGGMAWTDDEMPVLDWQRDSTERIPVFSTGASIRFNILGYLITEIYYAYPFQRPEKGGYIGFHIAPAW